MAKNAGDPVLMDKPIKGVYKYAYFDLDVGRIQATTKPTHASLGAYQGWSLPVYDSDEEELYWAVCIPTDWDGTSAFSAKLGGWLDTANTDKNFNLQLSYASASSGDTLTASVTDVPVETATGTAAQYKLFVVSFPIAVGSLVAGDVLAGRLRRIAASGNEITGEFVVIGLNVRYVSNYIGEPT